MEVQTLQAKIYSSAIKIAEDLANLGITKRICIYYKDTGKVHKGYLFVTNTKFRSVLPEAFVPGMDTLSLTNIQLETLIKSLSL